LLFTETKLKGAFVLELEQLKDERGFFARSWCQREFEKHQLVANLVQCSVSFNRKRGTLRGLHYQAAPHAEAKLVRCTQGAIYDVIVDVRPESPTYKQWAAVELSAENRLQMYIPPGLAHGFQTLEDATEVFYQMSELYEPSSAKGIRWNDPAFHIEWPRVSTRILSARDNNYPNFEF
jgi:dTDP-4-dehydrorhamnose 3,5-epimerase